tara:strand:- start:107 stop:457 length:351 start_codon:yes stop_codon:yes gene_type:complete
VRRDHSLEGRLRGARTRCCNPIPPPFRYPSLTAQIFFEPETSDFIDYVAKMRQTSTWGDELTLRAACDTFAVTMHVITSTKENWHLCYVPSAGKSRKFLFLTYVSPVHYNAIHLKG